MNKRAKGRDLARMPGHAMAAKLLAAYILLGTVYFLALAPVLGTLTAAHESGAWSGFMHHGRHLGFVALSTLFLAWSWSRYWTHGAPASGPRAPAGHHWFALDLQNWRIVDGSELDGMITAGDGAPPDSLKGWLRCVHPGHRSRLLAAWRLYVRGESESIQSMLKLRQGDGHYRWVQLLAHTFPAHSADARLEVTLTEMARPAQPLLHLFEQTTEGVIVTDPETRIIATNRAFERITGYSERQVLNRTPAVLSSGRHGADFYHRMWNRINRWGFWEGEIWNRRRDGTVYPEWMSITRAEDENGTVSNYVAAFSDISRIKQSEQTLYDIANHDHLTQLPNRMRLQTELQVLLQKRTDQQQLVLIALDLIGLRPVNDGLGFEQGDAALLEVARRLREAVGTGGTVARTGGDRFMILLNGENREPEADSLAVRIIERVNEGIRLKEERVFLHACAGIARFPADGTTESDLTNHANTALEAAKQEGMDIVRNYAEELSGKSATALRIESELRAALEDDGLVLHYQPQVRLDDESTVGVEALLRWPVADDSVRMPGEFLAVAEWAGLMADIDKSVHRNARRDATTLGRALPGVRIAINLAGTRLADSSLLDIVAGMLERWPLSPAQLEIEVTEDALMQSPESAAAVLGQLRELGITLAIDDFGTGHASLAHLKNFPVDRLKIDRSFVRHVTTNPHDRAICTAIIDMGHSLGLRVIAEGIESRSQARLLAELGCDEAQGNLFGRPMTAASLGQRAGD